MMRLLFLCLLAAATAFAEESEGSAVDGLDDEDLYQTRVNNHKHAPDSSVDRTTSAEQSTDRITLIVIVVVVTLLTLSIAAIVAVILVRRRMNNRQQGIYSVPAEQDQKGPV